MSSVDPWSRSRASAGLAGLRRIAAETNKVFNPLSSVEYLAGGVEVHHMTDRLFDREAFRTCQILVCPHPGC